MSGKRPGGSPTHEAVTQRIVDALEAGVAPWVKPWTTPHPQEGVVRPRRITGAAYSGINTIILWMEALSRGYRASTWMSFRQAALLGGHVRKGEKGCSIVYYGQGAAEPDDASQARPYRFLKTYTVFNVEQVEGLDMEPGRPAAPTGCDEARAFFGSCPATIRHDAEGAWYSTLDDEIRMPSACAFRDAESYYATLGHEMVHWTGAPSRLDRRFGRVAWGDEGYAREELVAELGSAFLAADLGLYLEPRDDHAAYISAWLAILGGDSRAIFSAAAHAERAVRYLKDLQPKGAQDPATPCQTSSDHRHGRCLPTGHGWLRRMAA